MPARIQVTDAFRRQLEGYGLTTAEILYGMPDHKRVLQTYIWQDYDIAPEFPVLRKFLDFWQKSLEGPLFSVRIGHDRLIRPAEVKFRGTELLLH